MNWYMNTYLWVGIFVLFILALATLAAMVGYVAEKLTGLWDRWKWNHEEVMARKIGQRILTESYWFSENLPAMLALQAIGESLRDGDGRIAESRKLWRDKMAAQDKQKVEVLE